MNRELIIKALNRAIRVYAKDHPVCETDVVTDFFEDRMFVATLSDRHPGALELPVQLEEGSGIMFLGWHTIHCNIVPEIAWEEDNDMHSMHSLLGYNGEGYMEAREAKKELAELISKFISRYPFFK